MLLSRLLLTFFCSKLLLSSPPLGLTKFQNLNLNLIWIIRTLILNYLFWCVDHMTSTVARWSNIGQANLRPSFIKLSHRLSFVQWRLILKSSFWAFFITMWLYTCRGQKNKIVQGDTRRNVMNFSCRRHSRQAEAGGGLRTNFCVTRVYSMKIDTLKSWQACFKTCGSIQGIPDSSKLISYGENGNVSPFRMPRMSVLIFLTKFISKTTTLTCQEYILDFTQ